MADTLLGTKIGHFRVVDKIATGGMGEVYAGFDETLQRKVAIKGIRSEYHLNEEAKVRFLREARVLSQLGHPNICQIFDYVGGDRSDFIIMEFIEGRSLKQALKAGIEARIRMRIAEQVAGVLVAAHEKGVIHRDLKPDNVMLSEGDQVKVLDFGLSRQLGDEVAPGAPGAPSLEPEVTFGLAPDTDATYGLATGADSSRSSGSQPGLTTVGTIMGTLGYMSPEQARGEVAMAASDMYSFGLLLQELFTGSPPFERELDMASRLAKARNGETLPVSGVDPDLAALINRLKSLAPGARPSAADTVAKLAWIREKPLRRRKKLLLSAAVVALAVFSVTMTVQSIRATRAEKRAREEAETAKQVSGFLVNLFKVSDPSEARGKTVTAREILDAGAKNIGTELKGQPLVQARMQNLMGTVYTGLGLYKDAEPLLSSALALREKSLPAGHGDLAESLHDLAVLDWNEGKYDEAESLYKRALAIRQKTLGADHPQVAECLNELGLLYQSEGKYAEAEPFFKQALAIRQKALGPDHSDVGSSFNNLGLLYSDEGKNAEAEPLFKQALAIDQKALGPDHPDVALNMNNLATVYWNQGKTEESEALFRQALVILEKVLGPDHPTVATNLNNLAVLADTQGRYAEAEPLYRRALAIREKVLGPDHPAVASGLGNLGVLYVKQGKYAEAEPLYKRALAIDEKAFGPDHPDVAWCLDNLATLYFNLGKYAEAEPLSKRAMAINEKALGPDHLVVASGFINHGNILYRQGRYAQAEGFYQQAMAIREKAAGARSRATAETLAALAACEWKERKTASALARTALCIEIGRELAAKTPQSKRTRVLLGTALLLRGRIEAAAGKAAEAQASWKESLSFLESVAQATRGAGDEDLYAQVLLCLDRTQEASPIVRKLVEGGHRNPDLLTLCREKGLRNSP